MLFLLSMIVSVLHPACTLKRPKNILNFLFLSFSWIWDYTWPVIYHGTSVSTLCGVSIWFFVDFILILSQFSTLNHVHEHSFTHPLESVNIYISFFSFYVSIWIILRDDQFLWRILALNVFMISRISFLWKF